MVATWLFCIGINLTYSNVTTDQAEHQGPWTSCYDFGVTRSGIGPQPPAPQADALATILLGGGNM